MYRFYILLEGKWEWAADCAFYLRPDVDEMLRKAFGKDNVKFEIRQEAQDES